MTDDDTTVAVDREALAGVLTYMEEELANRNHLRETKLAATVERLRATVGGSRA